MCKWVYSREDLDARTPEDPPFVHRGHRDFDSQDSGCPYGNRMQRKCRRDSEHGNRRRRINRQTNLVLRIEKMVQSGEFEKGTELFVFTDNFVSERAFYKGSSSSRLLHDLVLRLRKLEMKGELFVHFIWKGPTPIVNMVYHFICVILLLIRCSITLILGQPTERQETPVLPSSDPS